MTTGRSRPNMSIHLGLLLHNHQPVGNFSWVLQQVYEETYLPMIEALERYPRIRLSLHYTGSLLDWFAEAQPAFLQRINRLVQRKQVEIVGGGYYEPILPSIPDQDKLAQIRRLSEYLERTFDVKPDGMWLAERVWEPALPGPLRQANVEWTILDDVHFKNVGLDDDDLYGYYATEDQSSVLKVYATSKALRYTVPFRPAQDTIEVLRKLATPDGSRIVVMGDDGEKFGSWPGTYDHCWNTDGHSGWVDEFFTLLEQNNEWLHTTPLGEYARTHVALGRIYIPTSSYIEMTEWALPAKKSYLFGKLLHTLEDEKRQDVLQFMRGGFWRNFLARYDEANNQHKKMLRVHERVYNAGATEESGFTHLLKAQANDTYWHGLFGGIYMAHVRSAIYHHLIKAENAADTILHAGTSWQHYEFTDFERDTQQKLLIESDQQNLYLDPQHGGSLFEWDMRRSAHNMLCVMTRREESYHQTLRDFERERRLHKATQAIHQEQLPGQESNEPASPHTTISTKEDNLDHYLLVDRYRRASLIDHFLPFGLPQENFAQLRYEEQGNFAAQPYQTEVQQNEQGIHVTFWRDGLVKRPGTLSPIPVRLTKTLFVPLAEEKLVIRYTIENKGAARLQTQFATEWNFNLLGGGHNPQAYYSIKAQTKAQETVASYFDSTDEHIGVSEFHIGSTYLQQDLGFQLSQKATLWRFSIETVTGSEAGFERTHQGSCATLIWPLMLQVGEIWSVEITASGQNPTDAKVHVS
jgi:4-alpha-glucanotransferase